jgi:hypothetical protein
MIMNTDAVRTDTDSRVVLFLDGRCCFPAKLDSEFLECSEVLDIQKSELSIFRLELTKQIANIVTLSSLDDPEMTPE